ncbi:Pre-mRNA-splicing factor CLF1 [Grifola frondosa]|uniref:Pre-mRNA-splicing factor CLF1 n=1 Tax=Grifola frondosa TaxID=5627 RepID=A0A1C7LP06_GRIFR|nr:Pre-mRNA-splicing factor CLF1 [Grifola frondosa]
MQDGRAPRIKNRAPAAIQVTAEQLLRDAQERQESQFRAPKQRVEDFEELHEYRGRKREEFEKRIRQTRGNIKEWLQYANWEASQGEFPRSRSVFERALDVDPRSIQLWLSYTEVELKGRNVQHARNLFDRAVTLLPRVDQLWYKYVYLEELLQNVPGARQVFERWMQWEPDDKAWQAYIKMEQRYGELDRASAIYERWVAVRPEPRVWVKWGKFEEERGKLDKAREVFQTALEFFGDDEEQVEKAQAVFNAFAKMETRLKEYERARVIYKFALARLSRSKSAALNSSAWIKYGELETQLEDFARTRAIFELGVSQAQLSMPELLWKAYIDFETEEGEREKARALYERLIALSGHVKVWISYAMFEAEPIPIPRSMREQESEEESDEVPMVEGDAVVARQVFERGYKDLKSRSLKNERVVLLEVWKTFEENHGTAEDVAKVQGMMPIVSKKRHVDEETGQVVEDWDMVFADDERESNPTSFKFLQMAHAWKATQGKSGAGSTSVLSGFTAASRSSVEATATSSSKRREERDEDEDSNSDTYTIFSVSLLYVEALHTLGSYIVNINRSRVYALHLNAIRKPRIPSSTNRMASSNIFHPNVSSDTPKFGARLGKLSIHRQNENTTLDVDTPALITATSRGIVPHLSRDHVRATDAIRCINIPFESFLERSPPVPTLVNGAHPLHSFLGYLPSQHVVFMCPRDPSDSRKMPPNSKDYISVHCTRGVRKVTAPSWSSYIQACNPDIAVALSDIPFTPTPYSQKRLTKSIERSTAWLVDLLKLGRSSPLKPLSKTPSLPHTPNLLVHMVGGGEAQARNVFAESLTDALESKELDQLNPLITLDQGVTGYVFDLVSLRSALGADNIPESNLLTESTDEKLSSASSGSTFDDSLALSPLLQASLAPLPSDKLRVVNSARSPHEMLRLIRDVGIDLFDVSWAQRAADIGIALDFRFPVCRQPDKVDGCTFPARRQSGKRDLGHNLFDSKFAHDHSRLAASFLDGQSAGQSLLHTAIHPVLPPSSSPHPRDVFALSVGDAQSTFAEEVTLFLDTYNEDMVVFHEAKAMWTKVEMARGKGRLAREKQGSAEQLALPIIYPGLLYTINSYGIL